jgi:chromosome segregation and condensation protein ScpB
MTNELIFGEVPCGSIARLGRMRESDLYHEAISYLTSAQEKGDFTGTCLEGIVSAYRQRVKHGLPRASGQVYDQHADQEYKDNASKILEIIALAKYDYYAIRLRKSA